MTDKPLPLKKVRASQAHHDFHIEFSTLLQKYLSHEPPHVILAIVSQIVGHVIALQDRDLMTPEQAIILVQRNIEAGNAEAVAKMMETKGSA